MKSVLAVAVLVVICLAGNRGAAAQNSSTQIDCESKIVDLTGRLDTKKLEQQITQVEADLKQGSPDRELEVIVRSFPRLANGDTIDNVTGRWLDGCVTDSTEIDPELVFIALAIEDSEVAVLFGDSVAEVISEETVRQQVMGPELAKGRYDASIIGAVNAVSGALTAGEYVPVEISEPTLAGSQSKGQGVTLVWGIVAAGIILGFVLLLWGLAAMRRRKVSENSRAVEVVAVELCERAFVAGERHRFAKHDYEKWSQLSEGTTLSTYEDSWNKLDKAATVVKSSARRFALNLRQQDSKMSKSQRKERLINLLDASQDLVNKFDEMELKAEQFERFTAHLEQLKVGVPRKAARLLGAVDVLIDIADTGPLAGVLESLKTNVETEFLGEDQKVTEPGDLLAASETLGRFTAQWRNASHRLQIKVKPADSLAQWCDRLSQYDELNQRRLAEFKKRAAAVRLPADNSLLPLVSVEGVAAQLGRVAELRSEAPPKRIEAAKTPAEFDSLRMVLEKASSYLVNVDHRFEEIQDSLGGLVFLADSESFWKDLAKEIVVDLTPSASTVNSQSSGALAQAFAAQLGLSALAGNALNVLASWAEAPFSTVWMPDLERVNDQAGLARLAEIVLTNTTVQGAHDPAKLNRKRLCILALQNRLHLNATLASNPESKNSTKETATLSKRVLARQAQIELRLRSYAAKRPRASLNWHVGGQEIFKELDQLDAIISLSEGKRPIKPSYEKVRIDAARIGNDVVERRQSLGCWLTLGVGNTWANRLKEDVSTSKKAAAKSPSKNTVTDNAAPAGWVGIVGSGPTKA